MSCKATAWRTFISEASSRDPFAFSTLRPPRCMQSMVNIGWMVTLLAILLDAINCKSNQSHPGCVVRIFLPQLGHSFCVAQPLRPITEPSRRGYRCRL